jgi:hypothetical protein
MRFLTLKTAIMNSLLSLLKKFLKKGPNLTKLTIIGIVFLLIDVWISNANPIAYYHTYLAVGISLIIIDQFKTDKPDDKY